MSRKKARLHKRGRPRLAGPRFPNGQLKRNAARDHGTDELRARRLWLAGGGEDRTTYPLGVLLVNGAIGQDQHDAGARLAWLYGAVHGRISLAATRYEIGRGGGLDARDEDRLAEYQVELGIALAALSGRSRHILDDILDLAVYGRWPAFMRPGFPTPRQLAHAARVRSGLAILVGLRMRKAARLTA